MRLLAILFFLLCIVNSGIAQTQNFNFNIIHRGKEVGVLEAKQTRSANLVFYSCHTKTTLSLIMDFKIVFDNNLRVENGQLEYSDMSVSVNKKNYGKTITNRRGNEYVMENDGDEFIIKEFPITFCGSMFVFFEPKNELTAFSEKQGNFHTVKHIGNSVYEKTDPKGRINKYYYENGFLSKAEIDAGLIEFQIVKADEQIGSAIIDN
jgi:hypothetical protein